MNTVKKVDKTVPSGYKMGDLFVDDEGNVYMLCKVEYGHYVAISLQDGNYWYGHSEYAEDVIKGLTFYARNATITVEKGNG